MSSNQPLEINVARFSVAVGLSFSFLYTTCVFFMELAGENGTATFFNSLFHGLDVRPLVRMDMAWHERLLGVLESFSVGCLLGFLVSRIYNLLGSFRSMESKELKRELREDSEGRNIAESALSAKEHNEGHIRLHRSWRSILPSLIVALVVTLGVGVIERTFNLESLQFNIPIVSGGIRIKHLHLFVLVALVLCARPLFLLIDCAHEIGRSHVYSTSGRVSLKKMQIEISFEDILGVRVNQTLLQRMLKVGDIIVWTASADHPELTMKGIGNPFLHAERLKERVDKANEITRAHSE